MRQYLGIAVVVIKKVSDLIAVEYPRTFEGLDSLDEGLTGQSVYGAISAIQK